MIYDLPTGAHQQCSWCVCSPSLSESACGSELEEVGRGGNLIADGNSLEEQPEANMLQGMQLPLLVSTGGGGEGCVYWGGGGVGGGGG